MTRIIFLSFIGLILLLLIIIICTELLEVILLLVIRVLRSERLTVLFVLGLLRLRFDYSALLNRCCRLNPLLFLAKTLLDLLLLGLLGATPSRSPLLFL